MGVRGFCDRRSDEPADVVLQRIGDRRCMCAEPKPVVLWAENLRWCENCLEQVK